MNFLLPPLNKGRVGVGSKTLRLLQGLLYLAPVAIKGYLAGWGRVYLTCLLALKLLVNPPLQDG
ncbi:MAG TPA: hypothetical protein DCS91_07280 [Microcoleaceae bacterium UBA11344]|nr:hypothetical protein [Microcoleaceae cyanobacterium UBA11344]